VKRSELNYCFLLPLIWFNILFGNQVTYPGLLIMGQVVNWLIVLNISFLLSADKSPLRILKLFCLIMSILFRVISIIGFEQFYIVYLIFTSIVYVFIGNQFFNHSPRLLRRQIIGFVILCIPFMFLQVMGASSIFQMFNTLYTNEVSPGVYERPELKMLPLLFKSEPDWWFIDGYKEFLSMQSRPPGLLHSSAMLAPVVLSGAFLSFTSLSKRSVNCVDIAIIIAVVLTGAKMALYGYLFLLIIAGVKTERKTRRKILSMIFILAFTLLIYYIIFPDPFVHNHSLGAIQVSFGLRIIDVLQILGSSSATDIIDSVTFLSAANSSITESFVGGGQLSGLIYIIYAFPIMILAYIFLRPMFLKYYKELLNIDSNTYLLVFLALVWSFLVLLATPLLGNAFYGIILGMGLSPLLNNRRNLKPFLF
jgi:hypothetical protein